MGLILSLSGTIVDVERGEFEDATTKAKKVFYAWYLANPDKKGAPLRFGVQEADFHSAKVGDDVTFTPTISLSEFPGRKVGLNLKVLADVRVSAN